MLRWIMSHFPRLQEAVLFAAERHLGQDRDGKSALPYIFHPIDVVSRLRYVGGVVDETLLCVGALHDLIEECGTKASTIERKFGLEISKLVVQLTRREIPKDQRQQLSEEELWTLRTESLLDDIREKMEPSALVVKLADRLSNIVEALQTRSGKRLERYILQTRMILECIPRSINPNLWDSVFQQIPNPR